MLTNEGIEKMFRDFVRIVWAIFKKDLVIWIQRPAILIATFVPPLGFLLVAAFISVSFGRSPVAIVMLDHGRTGTSMQQILHRADAFTITDATPAQAQTLFEKAQVVAIITIPADFTQRAATHQQTYIDAKINNLNLNFTNEVRQQLATALVQFDQAQGNRSVIKILPEEQDLQHQDVTLFQYSVVPIIIMLLAISGVINGGLTMAHEWETKTIKELLLAPTSSSAIIVGKVSAGFLTTFLLGTSVLMLAYVVGWIHPEGIYLLTTLMTVILMSLMASALGVAIGASLQQLQKVIGLSINISLYLFFLSGGMSVLAFLAGWLQTIAIFIPFTYGRHALEMAVFYHSSALIGRDIVVLASYTLITLLLGILAVRREIAN